MECLHVFGVGNTLMGDDGIGVIVAERLGRKTIPGIAIIPSGLPGFSLVDELASVRRAVFIDAVDAGLAPGAVFWVEPDSLPVDWRRQSLHQVGLDDALALLRLNTPDIQVEIIGIQPERIGAGPLSPSLRRRLDQITAEVETLIGSARNYGDR